MSHNFVIYVPDDKKWDYFCRGIENMQYAGIFSS